MKRIIALVLSLVFVFSFVACGVAVEDNNDRGLVAVSLDGATVGTVTVANFQKKTCDKEIDGTTYYGRALSDILSAVDMTTVKAAFTKSADGYAQYFENPADIFIATYKVVDGAYESITNDADEATFTAITSDGTKAKEVTDIYLLTDAQDWEVKLNLNGEEKTITIADFMAMKPEYKTLNHKYNGGSDVFEGEFLAVDSKTFWTALGVTLVDGLNDETDDAGNQIPVSYVEGMDLTITGYVQASGSSLKLKANTDLKSDPLKEKTAWLVNYFVLVNGNDYHEVEGSAGADLGLSCIFSGTGIRWMTTPITEISLTPTAAE